jgi:hypothetical protein
MSEEFVSTARVPTYEAFLHAADLGPIYRWQKRFLQHLQLGCPNRRWVLKSPDHVYGLDTILTVFPDATIIQTRRDPVDVLKSQIQLTQVLEAMYAHPIPRDQLGLSEPRKVKQLSAVFPFFRFTNPMALATATQSARRPAKKLGVTSGSVTQSQNRPQRGRLPCFKAGISAVRMLKLTVVTRADERFAFSEGEGVERARYFASPIRTITLFRSPCLSTARTFAGTGVICGLSASDFARDGTRIRNFRHGEAPEEERE